jgi:hypothetical protein
MRLPLTYRRARSPIFVTRALSEVERPGKASGRLNAGASIIVRGVEGMGGDPMTPRGQFNRTFVVGLAGATIASLGLFTLSRAGGEIRDEGLAKLKVASDCVSGRQRIAGTFGPDTEVIAFNLPPI